MTAPEGKSTHPALLSYPGKAAFGRALPKNKIYEHSQANARLKELFVREVDQISWQYKLAPETINIPARPSVPEIQVFGVQLKVPELHRDVLRAIDTAVPFPIIFELGFDGRVQVVACYKRPNEADVSRWVLSDYFASEWLPAESDRRSMPMALDLVSLYEQLLHRLIPLCARRDEPLAALVVRFEQVQARQREVARTSARLDKERQFNRRVELNAALRTMKSELEQLSR